MFQMTEFNYFFWYIVMILYWIIFQVFEDVVNVLDPEMDLDPYEQEEDESIHDSLDPPPVNLVKKIEEKTEVQRLLAIKFDFLSSALGKGDFSRTRILSGVWHHVFLWAQKLKN